MAKAKPIFTILTYGIYNKWDKQDKNLPKIQKFTTQVPAVIDIEFGFILQIEKAKGKKLSFCIDHPGIKDVLGNVRKPFTGEEFTKQNSWKFYLGDTIWAPLEDKLGLWKMSISVDGKEVAHKTFEVEEAYQPNI